MKGYAKDISNKSALFPKFPKEKADYQKLIGRAEEMITRGVFTDVTFTHPPARIGLAALRAACQEQEIDIDPYLDTGVGLQTPEEVAELRGMLDEIQTSLVQDLVTYDPSRLGDIWTRAVKVWGKLGKKKKKSQDKDSGEPSAKKAKKEKKEKKEK